MKLSSKRRGKKQANPKSAEKRKEKIDEEVEIQLQRPKQTKKEGRTMEKRKPQESNLKHQNPPNKHSKCSGSSSKELEGQKNVSMTFAEQDRKLRKVS